MTNALGFNGCYKCALVQSRPKAENLTINHMNLCFCDELCKLSSGFLVLIGVFKYSVRLIYQQIILV